MEPIDIQYQLKKRGIMQMDIARELGVSNTIVSYVINKKMVSDRIMRAVAKAIGCNHREVFPEHYLEPKRKH